MKKTIGLLLAAAALLAVLVSATAGSNAPDGEIAAIEAAYYAGQDDRAFRMLNKSIFKNLLENGWLGGLEGIQDPVWNYDTFTAYREMPQDEGEADETLYCCTFSAGDDRCGYLIVSYSGQGLSRVRAVETPYLYDLRANAEAIGAELRQADLELSSATAARVGFQDEQGVWREGIWIADGAGNEIIHTF